MFKIINITIEVSQKSAVEELLKTAITWILLEIAMPSRIKREHGKISVTIQLVGKKKCHHMDPS